MSSRESTVPGDIYEFVGNEHLVPGEPVKMVTVVSVDPLMIETEYDGQRYRKHVTDEDFFFRVYSRQRTPARPNE